MMGMEVASEIYDYTDFLIASEEEVNTDGFPYGDIQGDAILTIWEDFTNTDALAIKIVDSYFASYLPGGSQFNIEDNFSVSCSALRMSEFSNLVTEINEFVSEYSSIANSVVFVNARENCVEFNDLESDVDIKDFFFELSNLTDDIELKTKCTEILNLFEDCFIGQRFIDYASDHVGTATIWFPDNVEKYLDLKALYSNLEFNELTNWSQFLEQTFQ